MALQRSNTRFGLDSLRGAPPESDDQSADARPPGPVSDYDSANKLRKRGTASRDGEPPPKTRLMARDRGREDGRPGLRELHSPRIVEKHTSPWANLEKRFSLVLNDLVIVASQKDARLVAVREFSGPNAKRKVDMLERIRDKNFVLLLDRFSFDESCYAIVEHEISDKETLLITLSQFARVGPYLKESQLAAVVGQVSPPWYVQHISNMKPRFWMAWNTSVQSAWSMVH